MNFVILYSHINKKITTVVHFCLEKSIFQKVRFYTPTPPFPRNPLTCGKITEETNERFPRKCPGGETNKQNWIYSSCRRCKGLCLIHLQTLDLQVQFGYLRDFCLDLTEWTNTLSTLFYDRRFYQKQERVNGHHCVVVNKLYNKLETLKPIQLINANHVALKLCTNGWFSQCYA